MPREKIDKQERYRAAAVPAKSRRPKAAAKKPKRKSRPPRSVRVAQSRPVDTKLRRDGFGVSVTLHMPAVKVHPWAASTLNYLRLPPAVSSRLGRIIPPLPTRLKRPVLLAAGLVVVFLVLFSFNTFRHKSVIDSGKVAAAVRTEPDFKPLVPSAAEASATSYDGRRNMVSYTTTFSGARLTVSQQSVPLKFGKDPNALQAAADSIQAKQRLDTVRGPLYIATNDTNDQLAIFADSHVLLFVHSDRKLDDASWKAFIELLKEKS